MNRQELERLALQVCDADLYYELIDTIQIETNELLVDLINKHYANRRNSNQLQSE